MAKNGFFLFLAHPLLIETVYSILPRDVDDLTVGFVSVVNMWMLWRLAVWMDQKKYYWCSSPPAIEAGGPSQGV